MPTRIGKRKKAKECTTEVNDMNDRSVEKQIAINMFFNTVNFALKLLISFFITPYITGQFGADAYGFIKLANDFTDYAALFSIALNSMASRFLMLERTRGNLAEAKKYYSSITLANIALTAIMVIPSIFCVIYLDAFLVIPRELTAEVKLVFLITFASFLAHLCFSTHGNCYYLTNKLSFGSIRDALMTLLRVACIFSLFAFATPRIIYVAIGAFVATVFGVAYNYYYTRKLTPEFRFCYADFEWKKLWEVISTGIWNSITKLSQIFTSGLDLLVTNIMIGSQIMGYFSVAKAVPTLAASFTGMIANAFSPNLMRLYAENDMAGLKKAAKTAMRIMCLFVSIPNAILITMGKEFFELWVPGQPTQMIAILAVVTIINSCVTGPTQPLYQIFTIVNKVKQSSIVMIVYGFISIFITYLCLQFTQWGVYAVAGVSMVGSIIVACGYHIPYAAKYIGASKLTFFPEIGISIISTAILCAVGAVVNAVMDLSSSWVMWFVGAILTGMLGLVINAVLLLNKEERSMLINKVFSKIGIRKG